MSLFLLNKDLSTSGSKSIRTATKKKLLIILQDTVIGYIIKYTVNILVSIIRTFTYCHLTYHMIIKYKLRGGQ